jgi:hypothetical protein
MEDADNTNNIRADRASSPAVEANCVKCGHGPEWGGEVECQAVVDLMKGEQCGCNCEFPTTTAIAAREAAERAAREIAFRYFGDYPEKAEPKLLAIILKHCSPVSGDVDME